MPSLKDIRGRIGSVRNIAQITRAMEMVVRLADEARTGRDPRRPPVLDEMREALGRVSAVGR